MSSCSVWAVMSSSTFVFITLKNKLFILLKEKVVSVTHQAGSTLKVGI